MQFCLMNSLKWHGILNLIPRPSTPRFHLATNFSLWLQDKSWRGRPGYEVMICLAKCTECSSSAVLPLV